VSAGGRTVAVDWGTSRFRATWLAEDGMPDGHVDAPRGIATLGGAAEFPAVLQEMCGPWLADPRTARIVISGMAGSRNGWFEAPYVPCPARIGDLRPVRAPFDLDGRPVHFVPGLSARGADGALDVIRGEETLIAGAVRPGDPALVCLPGTHSKWAEWDGEAVRGFATFMTGELHGLCLKHGLIGRLAAEPDPGGEGFARGLVASAGPGGVLHLIFRARTEVLDGRMGGADVAPFLSGVLVGAEIAGARELFGTGRRVLLVSEGPLRAAYREAFAATGVAADEVDAPAAFLAGQARIAGTLA
jgi:2-dehydro-3-deoxygalactonokinase